MKSSYKVLKIGGGHYLCLPPFILHLLFKLEQPKGKEVQLKVVEIDEEGVVIKLCRPKEAIKVETTVH